MDSDKIIIRNKCVWCKKSYETKTWIESKGMLKGQKIIESAYCSPKCEKLMTIKLNELNERIND